MDIPWDQYPIKINKQTELAGYLDSLLKHVYEGQSFGDLPCGCCASRSALEVRLLQDSSHEQSNTCFSEHKLFKTSVHWVDYPIQLDHENHLDCFINDLPRADPSTLHAEGRSCDFCLHEFGRREYGDRAQVDCTGVEAVEEIIQLPCGHNLGMSPDTFLQKGDADSRQS